MELDIDDLEITGSDVEDSHSSVTRKNRNRIQRVRIARDPNIFFFLIPGNIHLVPTLSLSNTLAFEKAYATLAAQIISTKGRDDVYELRMKCCVDTMLPLSGLRVELMHEKVCQNLKTGKSSKKIFQGIDKFLFSSCELILTYRLGSRDETTLPGKTVRDHFSEERFATGSHNFSLSLGEFLSAFDVSLVTGFLIGITSQEILSDVSNLSMPRARQNVAQRERNYQTAKKEKKKQQQQQRTRYKAPRSSDNQQMKKTTSTVVFEVYSLIEYLQSTPINGTISEEDTRFQRFQFNKLHDE
ncbi:hypothetical protein WN51_05225 [Melipona quadrifasciata]|uniref:Uncharacterized protein n=1 Tax=Melipona quadrifasciata TaxID=166423 RepID=A0A0M8ZSK5_9HYME|nr:hypothetical protein WN51_05225 [Melipona quadrifasciata]